jgi:drug/metabolite transporter (DMT)-like permease
LIEGWSGALAGEAACIAAAFLWAVAVALFRRPVGRYGARSVNSVKCLSAALLQGLTVLALGQQGELLSAPLEALLLVAASGLIGLVIGDTALFAAVARIGVHRTLLLQTLAPVFAALIGLIWLEEELAPFQVAGALLILAGIALVVAPRRGSPDEPRKLAAGLLGAGALLGVLSALGQGAGIVVAKAGMREIPFVAASFLRLGTAALGLLLIETMTGRLGRIVALLRDRGALVRVAPGTLLGTYLALFLMMAGVALAPVPVSAVLLSTSPVFSLFIEAAIERRRVTRRDLLGTVLAVAGVGVLTAL